MTLPDQRQVERTPEEIAREIGQTAFLALRNLDGINPAAKQIEVAVLPIIAAAIRAEREAREDAEREAAAWVQAARDEREARLKAERHRDDLIEQAGRNKKQHFILRDRLSRRIEALEKALEWIRDTFEIDWYDAQLIARDALSGVDEQEKG